MNDDLTLIAESLKTLAWENEGEIPYWGETIQLKSQSVKALTPQEPVLRSPSQKPFSLKESAVEVPSSREHPSPDLSKTELLRQLKQNGIGNCQRCHLGSTRTQLVFGVGNPNASVMFIGEGPGYEEDRKGEPFVGKAGQLLDKILASIGLDRTKVYIANIVKCHPMVDPSKPDLRGNDRPPTPEEMQECLPFLKKQIEIIHPAIIVLLGATAAKALLNTFEGITKLRGRLREVALIDGKSPIKVLPTYHPAALLRNPDLKKDVWEDMKLLRKLLNEKNENRA